MRELLIYRNILKDKVIKKINKCDLDRKKLFDSAALLIKEGIKRSYSGNILKNYIRQLKTC